MKWKLRDLVGKTSPYNLDRRMKEGLQRDIGEVTSFAKAKDFIEELLANYDKMYPPSCRSSIGKAGHVRSVKTGHAA